MKTELVRKLSQLDSFSQPDIELEQYMTPPELAADIIHTAYMQGDIENCEVVDLGTGTGILAIGSALAGARVTAVEKDAGALEIARENAEKLDAVDAIELVERDATGVNSKFDTCVMNPPFSVHSDTGLKFFRKAFSIADAVYSVAPRGVRERIKELSEEYGHEVLGVEEYTIALGPSYGFHTEESRETPVDVIITRRIDDNGT